MLICCFFFGDLKAKKFSLLPSLCPLFSICFLEVTVAVPDVVVVLAVEDVAVAERVNAAALLNAILPIADVPKQSKLSILYFKCSRCLSLFLLVLIFLLVKGLLFPPLDLVFLVLTNLSRIK